MTDDSLTLPSPETVILDPLRRLAKLASRYNGFGRGLVAGGTAAVAGILLFALARSDVPEPVRDAAIALGLGAAIIGTWLWVASVLLRSHRCHHHAAKFELDQLRAALAADCEQFVAGLDTSTLGRLAAQLDTIETSIPQLRAAVELERGVVLERINEAERRRAADLVRALDAARRRFEELLDEVRADVNMERERNDLVMKVLAKFIDGPAASPAADRLDAELRGFLAGQLHRDDPPEA